MAPQQMEMPDLTKIPLGVNPSGAPPNFETPPTLVHSALGTGVALVIIGGIFLAFRLGTNLKLSKKLRLDDYLAVFAFAGGIAYWVLNLINSNNGLARHTWDLPMSTFTIPVMQRQTAIMFVIAPTLWASKAAILALYIRIFGSVVWLRRTSWIGIVCMAIFYSLNIVAAGVYCLPKMEEMWGPGVFARCAKSTWIHVVVGVFSCIADLVILVLPFPVLMRLRVSPIKKITLGLVFGTGVILVVMSVVSLWLRVLIFKEIDSTWNATLLEIVTVIELYGTIAVSCAPAMSAFWLNIFTKTTIWSRLKSSAVFSYIRSRTSSSRQTSQEKPSFVATVPTTPLPPPAKVEPTFHSTEILRDGSYDSESDGMSKKSTSSQSMV
ncbi:hypothetical protein HBH98_076490 [Parastagonospora nodorum]|nr:hypothetical protein HBH51_207970 [Parastagonospora nodorum]KAH3978005.1 hypothetical protein HBH52_110020 [Parastagonospora nodorum]KAH4052736.1 hypothetical protein HBH49_089940 [Parastagonospora nodorum]KAH4151582.1 hypothetical protein HBH43_240220 [Parastagonospora nodorum]KAH4299473.1 hypothetical protein HBI01_115950 [Parastagonospora nodorum]